MPLSQIVSASIEDGAVAPVDLSSVAQYTMFKNRLINGAMAIDQRNNGASVTQGITGTQYSLDRWLIAGTTTSKFTVQQNAGSVTPPAGYSNYLGVTSSSAYSVLSTDFFGIQQRIEGLNSADLAFGTASAATVTLSFWVRSSLTGTFGGAINNGSYNRSYSFNYTISAANTWEQKSVTIAGDTTGTWLATNGIGINVYFGLGAGSNFTGAANTWSGSTILQPTGSVSVVGTNGATFYITGVQLEKGVTATSFDYRPYTTELQLCQRYAWKWSPAGGAYNMIGTGYASATTSVFVPIQFPVTVRSGPTFTNGGNWRVCSNTCLVVSSFTGAATGINSYFMSCAVTGATAGYSYALGDNNDTTAYLLFSAEL
jgi:hypothetical protein